MVDDFAVRSCIRESAHLRGAVGRLDIWFRHRDIFAVPHCVPERRGEIVLADWLVMALGFLTLVNPFLYSYKNAPLAKWNNLAVGGMVFILAVYQDWKDEKATIQRHH
jgi:hypothetical protein